MRRAIKKTSDFVRSIARNYRTMFAMVITYSSVERARNELANSNDSQNMEI